MRLDKFISQQLEISRAIASREIRASRVTVNGNVIRDSAFKLTPEHEVAYEGNILAQQTGPRYFMLNKPEGYVCATEDLQHPTILFFLEEPMANKLHAAGRLDIDTTGLVLLTDDGQWSHRLTSPRHKCEKTYHVTLSTPLTEQQIDQIQRQFSSGIMLQGEKAKTLPATITSISETEVWLTISEGRYHQVKRMFAAVGNHVVSLHRQQIGDIVLDDGLAPGEYRPLTDVEILSVGLPAELQQPLK